MVVAALGVARLVSGAGGDATPQPSPSVTSPDEVVAPPAVPATPGQPPVVSGPADAQSWPIELNQWTETVLLLDDGQDGVFAVDLDSGEVVHVDLPGQRVGDQPFRLWQMGGWTVAGWGEIFATTPGSDQEPRKLADATVFLPAAEPDQLWVIDNGDPGASAWTLIDGSGEPLAPPAAGSEQPIRGVPGGLALRRADGGLAKYDLEQQQVVDYLGDGTAHIADVTRHRVVWCEEPCAELTVSHADGRPVAVFDDAARFMPGSTWLSDDGQFLAAAVGVSTDAGVEDHRIRLYRVETGQLLFEDSVPLAQVYGDWSDAGRFFFWVKLLDDTSAPVMFGWWSGSLFEHFPIDPPPSWMTRSYGFLALPAGPYASLFGPSDASARPSP